MKFLKYSAMIGAFILLSGLFSVSALEAGGSFRIGNLALTQVESPSSGVFDGKDFSSWGLNFWVTHMLTDQFTMDAGFYTDPILQHISYTLFSYSESFLSIGVGPFFGFLNADLNTILKPGISTSIRIEIPTVMFLNFRTDSSLASRLVIPKDYIQERTDLSLGFYLSNAVCTLNAFSKRFTQKLNAYEVIDTLNEYSFITHLFKKNVPYRVTLKFAYQDLSKQFVDDTTSTSYILDSIIVGTKLEVNITDSILFYIDLDNSVYSFGREELLQTIVEEYAFRGTTGIEINLDRLIARPVEEIEF